MFSESAIDKAASIACASLLPEKSKIRYNQAFEFFMKWCASNNVVEITENVMLAYFLEKSNAVKSPSSLWCIYSMLKLTIRINKNQDISKFERLKAFLKRKNDGFKPKKSKIFTKEEIGKFLIEAPNQRYLMMKVIAIMGIAGACRTDELHKMKLSDIEYKDDVAVVKICETKNNIQRSFVISNNAESQVNWLKLLYDYTQLRPKNAQDERFFYRYERDRCVNQVVGKHTISKVPYEIAKYLNIKDAKEYTGHSFRRTSATLLANASGVDILDLKRHGGWKSSTVAESYIADSLSNKVQVANKILHDNSNNSVVLQKDLQNNVTTVNNVSLNMVENKDDYLQNVGENSIEKSINISNCTNCTFTFNTNK